MPSIELNRDRVTGTVTIVPSKMKIVSAMSGKVIVVPQDEWLKDGHKIIREVLTTASLPFAGEPSEFYNEWSPSKRRAFNKRNVWATAHFTRANPSKLVVDREGGQRLEFDDYFFDEFGSQIDTFLSVGLPSEQKDVDD